MLGGKLNTLLAVVEQQNFTKAAKALALTQPAVSHHIRELEEELGVQLIVRRGGRIILTPEGEIAVKYARRMKALYDKLRTELMNTERGRKQLRVGITHTAESNLTAEALAKCSEENPGLSITILTDTIKIFMICSPATRSTWPSWRESGGGGAAVGDAGHGPPAVRHVGEQPPVPAGHVTLEQLKRERMILRLPTSATRVLFEATLRSINDAIENFNVTLEVDNIATIKDLIRKDLGVSILPKSACMDELRKGKIAALPIEDLSMVRETRLVYHKDFGDNDILEAIVRAYQKTAGTYD